MVDCWVGRDPWFWDRSGIRSIVDRDLGISAIPRDQGTISMSAGGVDMVRTDRRSMGILGYRSDDEDMT